MEAGAQDRSLQQQEYHLIGNLFELEGRTLPTVRRPVIQSFISI